MDTVNIVIVRVIQTFILLFLAFALAGYFGILALLPLAAFYHLISFLSDGIGFNGIFAAIIAGPAIAWLIYSGYKIPGLYGRVLDLGLQMFNIGKSQLVALQNIVQGIKDGTQGTTPHAGQA